MKLTVVRILRSIFCSLHSEFKLIGWSFWFSIQNFFPFYFLNVLISLSQFTFQSYSVEDDDYQGYDYSLTGRLSAVRIVFLYRFVQEVSFR